MIKLANSVGNHHKIRSQCYLGGGESPPEFRGGSQDNTWSPSLVYGRFVIFGWFTLAKF